VSVLAVSFVAQVLVGLLFRPRPCRPLLDAAGDAKSTGTMASSLTAVLKISALVASVTG